MPVITIEGPKISKAIEIMNIPEQAFVTLIKENDYNNTGNGQ